MKKHIHIFGASGSGTTTISQKVCGHTGYSHFDSVSYFWLPPPPGPLYSHARARGLRSPDGPGLKQQPPLGTQRFRDRLV